MTEDEVRAIIRAEMAEVFDALVNPTKSIGGSASSKAWEPQRISNVRAGIEQVVREEIAAADRRRFDLVQVAMRAAGADMDAAIAHRPR